MRILPRHNISGTSIINGGTLVLGDKQRLTPSLQNAATLVSRGRQNREISIYNDSLRCSQDPQQNNGFQSTWCNQKYKKKSTVNTAELRQIFPLRENTLRHVVEGDGRYPRAMTPSDLGWYRKWSILVKIFRLVNAIICAHSVELVNDKSTAGLGSIPFRNWNWSSITIPIL